MSDTPAADTSGCYSSETAQRQTGAVNNTPMVVTILPGIPAMEDLTVDDGRVPYPDSTTDFAKVLRERGFEVRFTESREQRRYAGHKAWELWAPILQFSIEVLVATQAGVLLMLLDEFLPGERGRNVHVESSKSLELGESPEIVDGTPSEPNGAILHIDWRVLMPDGREERFAANGDASEVRKALADFERHVRDI